MKRVVAALMLLALPCLAAGGAGAGEKGHGGSQVTLTGEVLDLACYINHGGRGAEHAVCALKCAEMGQPIGLAASDGKVYLLVADHADSSAFDKAKTLAGRNVEIKGQAAAKDGIHALTVLAIRAI